MKKQLICPICKKEFKELNCYYNMKQMCSSCFDKRFKKNIKRNRGIWEDLKKK